MSEKQSAYRQIFKATSLFSGVQFFNIIFAIARSKIAALLIGPAGIGILGVLNATLNMIGGISKLGLDLSSVKEIAFLNSKGEEDKLKKTVGTLQKLLWVIGIAVVVLTMIFSNLLSKIAFGSNEYGFYIFWVSLALLFKQLSVGNLSVLQGMRRLKSLARANLISSFLSVLIVIPCYYYLGIKGIIPVIILTALSTFIISRYFVFKEGIVSESRSLKEVFSEGKDMMKLGAVLSISTLLSLVVAYALQVYITNVSGVEEVGYFNAGFIIVNSYVGLIFNAMSKDYFPRLSSSIEDNAELSKMVNYQASIALLLLIPVVVIFICFAPFLIELLYSSEFLPVVDFVILAIIGMLFKAISWSLGYVIIAKGDSRIFVRTAVGFNILLISMNIIGYHLDGLGGLGLSFLLYFVLHLIGMLIITRKAYGIKIEKELIYILFIGMFLCFLALFISVFGDIGLGDYIEIGIVIVLSIWLSYSQLNKRLDLKELFKRFREKK